MCYNTRNRIISTLLLLWVGMVAVFAQQGGELFDESGVDTVAIEDVTVNQTVRGRDKITGMLSGKIVLNTEAAKGLPNLSGSVDLLKVLELTPGVQTSGDGNSNMYVRGGDPGHSMIFYNGVNIYTSGHLMGIFPLFSPDHVSNIEFLKSGVNAQYGNFLSASILANTKSTLPQKTSVKGNIGILMGEATLELPLGEKWGLYLTGRETHLNLILKPLTKKISDVGINDLGYNFYDGNLTLIGQLSKRNKLVVSASLSYDKLGLDEDMSYIDVQMKWENAVLSAKLETQFNKDLYLEQTFFYSGYRNNLDIQQVAVNSVIQSSIEDIGYKNLFRYQIKNIPFESGIQYAYHNLRPLRYETSNANLRYDEEGLGRNGAHDFSAFVTSNFKITSRITLEPGLRYNFYSNYSYIKDKRSNFNSLDFRLLGRYRLGRANYLRLGCGNNNQHINKLPISSVGLPADSWISSSDVVLPQKGMEVSLGYYHSINNDAFEFSSDVYYKRMSGVVEYYTELIRDKEMDFIENAYWGDGQAYGIEFMVKKNLGKFTGWLSYTLGRSERWFDEIDEGRKFLARYDRTHDLSFVGSYVFNSKWDVSLVCVYASGNRYTQPSSWYFINNTPVREYGKHNGARLPYYSRVDVSINYWFREDNGINVSVYNLLMAKNPIFIAMTIFGDENNNLRLSMMRQWLFTIMPSVSWRFKF